MAFASLAELVQHYESGGNYTAQSPTSSASGAYQFINSTWLAAARAIGVDTSAYPTAVSAPAAVQDAAFNAVVSSRGLADWTCPNCDPALTNYLSANPSAANLPAFASGTSGTADGGVSVLPPLSGDDQGASVGAGGPSNVTQPGSLADKVGSVLSPAAWLAAIGTWFSSIAPRAVLFVVAVLLLLGAFYLFGTNRAPSP